MLSFVYYDYRVGEREMWSQCTTIEISSLLLWPVDPLLSDALLYFYDNKHILNKLVALFQTSMAGPCLRFPTTCLAEICGACRVVKQAREKNIIIRGMPQSENKSDDDLIRDLFADIGLNDLHFTGTTRLGKPAHPPPSNSANSVDANDNTNTESSSQSDRTLEGDTSQTGVKAVGETKHRPIKITLNSVKDKWKVLESAPKVRTVESNHYNPKNIWIAQDLTKNARQRELDLRKQLNEKRTQDPENRYVIKNGEVVRRM